MADETGEKKKKLTPEETWNALEEAFNPKNKNWQELYADHDVAATAARNAMKESETAEKGTTRLGGEQIIEKFGKGIEAYDETIRGKVENGKEYRKLLTRGEARSFIEEYARQHQTPIDDFLRKLQREGLEEILHAYSINAKDRDVRSFRRVLVDKHVDTLDYDLTKQLAAKLKKEQPLLKPKEDFIIQSEIIQYLVSHFVGYHETQPVETKEKKEEKKAA